MPGCDCENKNFQIAYEEQTSLVKQIHPDWSERRVKLDVAQFLRPKFRQDIDSRNAERQGIEKSDPIEFELTADGTDILFTKYGRTLSELNERTRTLTPEQYNPIDAVTNAAIINAIKQGAGHIVTSYWRHNGDNRDLLEITFDSNTGVGTSRTINTEAHTGKTHSYDEMSHNAKSLFQDLQVQRPDEKVFIATDISLDISLMRQSIHEKGVHKYDAISTITQDGIASANHVVEDVKETFRGVIDYVSIKKSEASESGSELTVNVRDYFLNASNEIILERSKYVQSEILHSFGTVFDVLDGAFGSNAVIELSTTPDINESTVTLKDAWVQNATETLSISESEASLLLITTSKLHDLFMVQNESLRLVESLAVGHGALFFALDTFMMTELPISENAETSVINLEYSTESSFQGEFSKEQTAELYAMLLTTDVLDSIHDIPIERQLNILQELHLPESILDVDFIHFINIIEFIQKVDNSPSERKIELIKSEQMKSIENIDAVHQAIVEMITKRNISHEKSSRYAEFVQRSQHQSDESVSNEQDIYIENFSLALSFWMMIKLVQYVSSLQKIETYVNKQLLSTEHVEIQPPFSISKEFMNEHGEDIIQRESAPWLLLAIIWHLTMIREQGFAQAVGNTTQKPKKLKSTKKKSNSHSGSIRIPDFFDVPTGVIYAFNHAMIEL